MAGERGAGDPGRTRTSNPERSAATRLKVLEGAVEALNRLGYGGVTTTVLCEASGVTRGGLLHHFPSKAGLMVAAAEHCLTRLADDRRERRQAGDASRRDVIMESLLEPYGVALMELIVASRSDPDLKARFGPVIDDLMRRQDHAVGKRAAEWGSGDLRRLHAMVYLHMAARRGLAMLVLAGAPADATADALELLAEHREEIRGKLTRYRSGG